MNSPADHLIPQLAIPTLFFCPRSNFDSFIIPFLAVSPAISTTPMIPQKNPPSFLPLPHFCLLYLHDSLFQIKPPSQADGPLSNWRFPLTSTNQAWMLLETQPRELGRRIILRGHTNDLRRERMPNDSIRESLDRIAIIIFCRPDDPTIGESDIRDRKSTRLNSSP